MSSHQTHSFTGYLGSNVLEIEPIANFQIKTTPTKQTSPLQQDDDSCSMELDESALAMLGELALDEEIEDEVDNQDKKRGILDNRD